MKKLLCAMKPFIQEISHDFMLIACLAMPIIMGVAFKFALPILENVLCVQFVKTSILSPYYLIFDLLLAIMTPMMFTFVGVMTVLSEMDNGTTKYLCVTPIGKSGYLLSRIGIPSVIAFFYDALFLSIFSITNISFLMNIAISFSSVLLSLITSMLVISLAKNKLEGMGLIKMCGFLILGIPAVYFIPSSVKYAFAIFPTFWLTKLGKNENYIFLFPTILISLIWISLLSSKFKKKFL